MSLNFEQGDFVEEDFEFISPQPPVILFPFSIFNTSRRRRRVGPTLPKEKEKEKPKPKLLKLVVKDVVFRYAIEPPAPPEPVPPPEPSLEELETDRLFAQIREDIARKEPITVEVPRLRHLVVKDVTFPYNINQLIEKDVTFDYQTQQIVVKDVTFVYDIKEVNWIRVASLQRAKANVLALDLLDRVEEYD